MTSPEEVFSLSYEDFQGKHRYFILTPADPDRLVKVLAPRLRRVYFDAQAARQRLIDAAAELKRFHAPALEVTESEIERALEEELDAVLPAEWKGGRPQQTNTQRSELAEIIASEILQKNFGFEIPASRITHKEVPDQQTRGVDVLALTGIDTDQPALIIAEVKGSCDRRQPPPVVADMAKKLNDVAGNRRSILQELIWLRDHCEDRFIAACTRICSRYLMKRLDLEIRFAPVLIRTENTSSLKDFGVFYKERQKSPYAILFASAIIPSEDLFQFAVSVYREARRINPL